MAQPLPARGAAEAELERHGGETLLLGLEAALDVLQHDEDGVIGRVPAHGPEPVLAARLRLRGDAAGGGGEGGEAELVRAEAGLAEQEVGGGGGELPPVKLLFSIIVCEADL